MDKLLLVGNPTSNSGKAAKKIERAGQIMTAQGLAHEFRSTLPGGKTVDMVRKAIDEEGFELVIYSGGDGTFYEVATGICRSKDPSRVIMGMLPSGTANDQGKSFGISSEESALEANIETIQKRHTIKMDVGHVSTLNEKNEPISSDYFFDSIGWGLSAAILNFRNRELQQVKKMPIWRDMYKDRAVYIRAAFHEFAMSWFTRDRFTAELIVDGEAHQMEYLTDLVITNTLVYAADWIPAPDSKPDDGRIEACPFRGLRDWTSKMIITHKKTNITQGQLDKIGLTHSPVLSGSSIDLHILRPNVDKRLPAQRDGEEFVETDQYRIRVLPNLLNLIVPKNFHWI